LTAKQQLASDSRHAKKAECTNRKARGFATGQEQACAGSTSESVVVSLAAAFIAMKNDT